MNWTIARIERLYERYNRKYWNGKLPIFRVRLRQIGRGALGFCDLNKKLITIDVNAHKSDMSVRETLLHEMAHVAAGSGGFAHGSGFWAQIERLLKLGARLKISAAEAPTHQLLEGAIPRKFRLSRAAGATADKQVKREWSRLAFDGEFDVDADVIAEDLEDAAALMTWKRAVLVVGGRYGLVDIDGKPTTKAAARLFDKARRGFQSRRRLASQSRTQN